MPNNAINKILSIVKEAGEIEGRKKFQKIVFILQSKGLNIQERFKYHYYGPFSNDLQFEIDDLVDNGILNEDHSENFYAYKLMNDDFIVDKEIIAQSDLVKYLNSLDTCVLELASTLYFLKREGYTEKGVIEKKLKILKPHLMKSLPQTESVVEQIDKMYELY